MLVSKHSLYQTLANRTSQISFLKQAFVSLVFSCAFLFVQAQKIENGVLDLRNVNLVDSTYKLDGKWRFAWRQLIDSPKQKFPERTYISLPGTWGNQVDTSGLRYTDTGFATYMLTVLLPKKHEQIAIRIPDLYSNYRLYVNNQLEQEVGKVGQSKDSSKPYWFTSTIGLSSRLDTVKIILQISNFHLDKGGISKSIYLGSKSKMFTHQWKDLAIDFTLGGCLFMGGLFFFVLYFFGRGNKAILYFSLFCLVFSTRMVATGNYALHYVFPSINWLVSHKMEYITLCLGVLFFTRYALHLYPEDTNKKVVQVITVICLTYATVVLLMPPHYFNRLLNFFLVIVLLIIGYNLFIFTYAAYKKRIGSRNGLYANFVAAFLFVTTILVHFNVIAENPYVQLVGYIAFFFLQSLVISNRFAHVLIQAKESAEAGLQEKSKFLSTMSHEIRTPLNAVIGITNLMQHDEATHYKKENLEMLSYSAHNLLSIVNNVLDYNKIEANKYTFEKIEMDISAVIKNAVKSSLPISQKKGIDLHAEIDGNIPKTVLGDPTKLGQVINNLINNAIKFTSKGFVKVRVVNLGVKNGNVQLSIGVEDSGIGIAADKLDTIFDPFSQADSSITRHFGGTGLGLTICKQILEAQEVQLRVKSKVQEGSNFYFVQTFAIVENAIGQSTNAITDKQLDEIEMKGLHVLLVDDNELNLKVANIFLYRWGAKVEMAYNGREAIEKYAKANHDLILMDIQMPEMDGLEATKILRMQGATCPIIALTANVGTAIYDEAIAAGMNDLLVKPFKPNDLKMVILKYASSYKEAYL